MKATNSEPKISEPRASSFQPATAPSLYLGRSLSSTMLPAFTEAASSLTGVAAGASAPIPRDRPLSPPYLLIRLPADHADLARLWFDLPEGSRAKDEQEGYAIDAGSQMAWKGG